MTTKKRKYKAEKKAKTWRKGQPVYDPATLIQPTSGRMFLWFAELFNRYYEYRDDLASMPDVLWASRDILARMPYDSVKKSKESMRLVNMAFEFNDGEYLEDEEFWAKSEAEQMQILMSESDVCPPDDAYGPVPLLPSRLERRWLRSMLEAPEAQFLVSDKLRDDLLKSLKGVRPIDFSFWRRIRLAGDDITDEGNVALLSTIFKAVRERRALFLEHDGATHTLIPLRIRYNLWTNRYSLIALDKQAADEEARFPRYHLHAFTGLREGEKLSEAELAEARRQYEAYCARHRRYFHLRVRDERNGRERCYALFATFDKTSFCESDGVYRLTIAYYTFDEDDVLSRLLALGPVGVVLPDDTDKAPEEFGTAGGDGLRRRVVECLRAARRWYQD